MHFSSKTCGILSCELSTQLVGLKIQTCSHKASFVENTKATRRIRYDTIEQFNVDSKAEYLALSSTRSQKKKLKQTTPVPL